MNPFLFKAHALLYHLVNFLTNPAARSLDELLGLLTIVLAINLLWATPLLWIVSRDDAVSLSPLKAYLLALPATLMYAPTLLTVVADVTEHAFHLKDRLILVIAIFVASQMLGGFYAIALRQEHNRRPVGLVAGMTVSLFLLLVSMAASLLLLWMDEAWHFMPEPGPQVPMG
ncbi:hypothetical protein [Methylomagnum sp.]